jgi:hypothetical protein
MHANMSQKTIVLIIVLMVVLCLGMWRFAVLWQGDQNLVDDSAVDQQAVQTVAPPDLPEGVLYTESFVLPVTNSAPTQMVRHKIPLQDIRRGCFRQDCIPSIEDPTYVPAIDLADTLATSSLGIVLWDADRFYPFPMLETHELVNDTLPDGSAVLVSYCPLCGTGIVFNRNRNGVIEEFGVSGMLWQSNLLMYNRTEDIRDRNLWSQVLGQAVVGDRAGEMLAVLPSDIIRFGDWLAASPNGETLISGTPQDPYAGNYYDVASSFGPDFEAATSPIDPESYVHGLVVNGQPKAYLTQELFDGMTDIVAGERIFVAEQDGKITFIQPNAEGGQAPTELPDIEGFWFSWQSAHPNTLLWIGE